MTLLITLFAAIISTVCWYRHSENDTMMTGTLSLIFWGASLMWLVDAIFEYAELKAEFFHPAPLDVFNDALLGLAVVALGLCAWLVVLLVKDPKGRMKDALLKKKS